MRCVFDTNTLISAVLFKDSVPGKAFRFALSQGEILISVESIDEISEVIYRRKSDKYLTDEERAEFLQSLLAEAILVEVLDTARFVEIRKMINF